MACFHPLDAWQTRAGEVILSKEQPDSTHLRLPCGGCLGCRKARAKEWALRCHLELQQHEHASWTTLTYSDANLPNTLDKRALQLWLKRIRSKSAQPLRFFGCGEYGETFGRPHYHVILYGLSSTHARLVDDTWGQGHTRTYPLTPQMISYTAGYTAKKIGWKLQPTERVNLDTGEVYTWQPPFIQMSRRPGIGGHARQWPESWRLFAVHNGQRMAVPRFLHESWKQHATPQQLEELLDEKHQLTLNRDISEARIRAAELIAIKEHQRQAERRRYD